MLSPREILDFEIILGDLLDSWKVKRDELDDVAEQLMETIELVCEEVAEELEE